MISYILPQNTLAQVKSYYVFQTTYCSIKVGNDSLFQIENLQKYTDYVVRIKAETGKGVGPFSVPPLRVRTEEGGTPFFGPFENFNKQ